MIGKLKERYGLTEKEARRKADAWMKWIIQGTQKIENPGRAPARKLADTRIRTMRRRAA
jgi:hypothetical protein